MVGGQRSVTLWSMRSALAVLLLAVPAFAGDVRAQFLMHCASCHGESGDGHGTATLDRPARSFLDGGFSYGNTPEALYRTITHGIPGTPMPAAPSVLSDADRQALAAYVISLGPKIETASVAESTIVVRDRPEIVRGKLPPVAPDLPERPRGLLLGTTDGLSFEYRTDDVRLLAVRQGAFVDRQDWRGRGGSPLQPLGVPIHLCGGGDPGPAFLGPDGTALAARFTGSFVDGERAGIRYRLDGAPVEIEESARGVFRPFGSGFERTLLLRGSGRLVLRLADPGPTWIASGTSWTVRRRADGVYEAIGVRGEHLALEGGRVLLRVDLGADARTIAIRTILSPVWNADVESTWIAEMRS